MREFPASIARELPRLFWDVDPNTLDPERHEDFVIARVLNEGSWEMVRALREVVGDAGLSAFVKRAGHRLDARTLRFMQVVLELSEEPCRLNSSNPHTAPLFPR